MRCRAVLVATLSVALLLTASRVEANSGAVRRRVLLSMADTAAQTISLDESVVNEDMNLAPEMNDTAGNMTEMANDTIADDENFAWGNLGSRVPINLVPEMNATAGNVTELANDNITLEE